MNRDKSQFPAELSNLRDEYDISDFDLFRLLYKKIGVPFEIDEWYEDAPTVEIVAQNCPNIIGYSGFTTTYIFDVDGNFVKQDIWE